MAANVQTGKVREVRYCGRVYTITPGETYGKKQVWVLSVDGEPVRKYVPTLPRCVYYIHEHATSTGTFPAQLADGKTYQQLLTAVR